MNLGQRRPNSIEWKHKECAYTEKPVVHLIVMATPPLKKHLDEPSVNESQKASSRLACILLASTSSIHVANHKGVSWSKAEPWMEQVGEEGKERVGVKAPS